jgi:hypothetical protein
VTEKKAEKYKYVPEQLKTFWFWINERHAIHQRRKTDLEGPWTKDEILKKYKFTNPFRQNDRVTQSWIDRYVFLLGSDKPAPGHDVIHPGTGRGPSDGDILFHLALFRLFNWPPTYDALYFMAKKWSYGAAMEILEERRANKEQIFTGAYIITNLGSELPKIDITAGAVDIIHENRVELAEYIRASRSMEKTCEVLQLVPTVGPFIAYEMACDLRFTRILSDLTDANVWANPGPGAKRGIHRLLYGTPKVAGKKPDHLEVMRDLLRIGTKPVRPPLSAEVRNAQWPFELREIEHSLCEFDKYMRVRNGEGRPRSLFKPTPAPPWDDAPKTRMEAKEKFDKKIKRSKKTGDMIPVRRGKDILAEIIKEREARKQK